MDRLCVGIKYCGGCREQYDRKGAVQNLQEALACENIEFVQVEKDRLYDVLLVINGCQSRCADLTNYNACRIIATDSFDGCTQAQNELKEMINKE